MIFERLRGIPPAQDDAEGQRPLNSLVAAAAKISGMKVQRGTATRWQDEAWCVDDATEILTTDGWRSHADLAPGDLVYTLDHGTGLAGWEPVTEVARFDVTDEPMLKLSMRHHSSLTTLAHRWPVLRQTYDNRLRAEGRARRGRERAWTTSRALASEDQIITAAPSRDLPTEAKWSDAFVELVAWFWTEGSIRPDRRRPSVKLSQSETANPDMCVRIRRALTTEFGPAHEGTHQGRHAAPPGWRELDGLNAKVWKLNVAAAETLLAVAPDKVIDLGFIRSLTLAQLLLFIDVSVSADGHRNGYPAAVLAQRDRSRIEPLLVACVLAGMTPHLWFSDSAQMWTSSLLPRATATPRRNHREVVSYTGTVWCPVTPSQTWLARRDGTVWFTGNTLYDEVGELRYVANALASGMSRARLFVARLPAGDDDPQPVEADRDPAGAVAAEALAALGGGAVGRAELVRRLALQLFVAGDGYLCGLPPGTIDDEPADDPPGGIGPGSGDTVALQDMGWHTFAVQEANVSQGTLTLQVGDGRRPKVADGSYMLIRVWRPHPRRWWQADSPVRSNLPVLRELVGLTKHVSASIDSRLAGAGLLILPQSIEVVSLADPDNPDGESAGLLETLMDHMLTPIKDRDSAAAIVPVIATVADEIASQIGEGNLIRFSTPFDEQAKDLRDEAIRRLALGLDAPPEELLGLSTGSHWSAWAIQEATVQTHIEPPLALICDAITTQYLWPILRDQGVDGWRELVVWYDTVNLTMKPDRSGDAKDLHAVGAINDDALRRETGFSDDDRPEGDPAVLLALRMVAESPQLLSTMPLADLVGQVRAVLSGTAPSSAGVPAGTGAPDEGGRGMPDTRDDNPLRAAGNGRVARG